MSQAALQKRKSYTDSPSGRGNGDLRLSMTGHTASPARSVIEQLMCFTPGGCVF
jgi:hypothetical protein